MSFIEGQPEKATSSVEGGTHDQSTVIQGNRVSVHFSGCRSDDTPTGASDIAKRNLGRPITEWDPHDLEVHPAIQEPIYPDGAGESPNRAWARLPEYVYRSHDNELQKIVDAAVAGKSQMAVLVGSSSTGKTRSCWESIRPLASKGWTLWHPFYPTPEEAALSGLQHVDPRTIIWLNETQRYFSSPDGAGERIAAHLHSLLTDAERGPVLVLGTLWPNNANYYTDAGNNAERERNSRIREVLAGRIIPVPEDFNENAYRAARSRAKSGDGQWEHALEHVAQRRFTQFLAGAPELVRRYENSPPAARSLLRAAIDARRLGMGIYLPLDFLSEAAEGYIPDEVYDSLEENWVETALDETSRPTHGGLTLLRRVRTRKSSQLRDITGSGVPVFRLADYLEQQGQQERWLLAPPESFWLAAERHVTDSHDLTKLARSAYRRGFYRHSLKLSNKASKTSSPIVPSFLLEIISPQSDPNAIGKKWILEHIDFTEIDTALDVLRRLYESGNLRVVNEISGRLALRIDTKDTRNAARLVSALLETGQESAIAALLDRDLIGHSKVDQTQDVASLISSLHEAGHHKAVTDLIARDPMTHVDLSNQFATSDLVKAVAKAGRHGALVNLSTQIDPRTTMGVASLISSLHEAGHHKAVTDLIARDPMTHVDLSNQFAISDLVEALESADQHEAIARLASHISDNIGQASTSVICHLIYRLKKSGQSKSIDQIANKIDCGRVVDIDRLIFVLRMMSHHKSADRLESHAVAHADPTQTMAIADLAKSLHLVERHTPAKALARKAVEHANIADTGTIANLINTLIQADQHEEIQILLGRGLASKTDPRKTDACIRLVSELYRAGHDDIASYILTQAVENIGQDRRFSGLELLQLLNESGKPDTANNLEDAFLDAGILRLPDSLFPYGRELDGTPSPPWAWEDTWQ